MSKYTTQVTLPSSITSCDLPSAWTRRVTHSSILGENAYLVENTTSTFWFLCNLLAEMSIWRDFIDRYVLENIPIGYRHISVRFCACETPRCASYLLLERANWLLQRPSSAFCRRIIGDFNIDLLQINESVKIQIYFDLFCYAWYIPNIIVLTRSAIYDASLIDQLFCKVTNPRQYVFSCLIKSNMPDHKWIYL